MADAEDNRRPSDSLSARQRKIARLVASGRSNGEIATSLGVSLDEAKRQVMLLRDRAGTRSAVGELYKRQTSGGTGRIFVRGVFALALLGVITAMIVRLVLGSEASAPATTDGQGSFVAATPRDYARDGRMPVRFDYFPRPGETAASIAAKFDVAAGEINTSDNPLHNTPRGPFIGLDIPAGADALAFVRFGMLSSDSAMWPTPPVLDWPLRGRVSAIMQEPHLAGIDIATDVDIPIYAASSGVVLVSTIDPCRYGRHIVIDHGNGYATIYGNLSQPAVEVGHHVRAGSLLGRSGRDHKIHFEMIRTDDYLYPGLVSLVLCPGRV